ncbi:MAG: hypothetical protein V4639_00260 [Pseudomonadota bacterium]|nr:hypothetical protein [Polaromonas sp.]
MNSLRAEEWLLIGAISPQDRCLSMMRHNGISYKLAHAAFLEVVDEPSEFSVRSASRREANRLLWQGEIARHSHELHTFGLFEPIRRLQRLVIDWTSGQHKKNIILDVSCLPERFFFPILRWLIASEAVENLIVACMHPSRYTEEDLAYNPQDWAQLPTFVSDHEPPEPSIKRVIVGAGFLPFSLPDWLKKTYNEPNIQLSVLLPFPASPANVKRAWEFVRQIEVDMTLTDERQLSRIAVNDMSGCFDRLQSITRNGAIPSVFAPYGPKSHSVAMCLHAIEMGAEVFYTQPSFYHPEYTTGIRMEQGLPAGHTYALRIGKRMLYQCADKNPT